MSAPFVAFEGVDGAGKSTQARLLAERLGAVLTREPGGTPIGTRIRSLLLDPETVGLSARAEALLMAADRAQHVEALVRPALAAGRPVVTDRYLYSSVAYQGYGRDLDPDEVRTLSLFAVDGLLPDLVVLVELPDEVAEQRFGARPDRFEGEGPAFRRRVAEGYRALAAADPDRWLVVDGVGSIDEVAERVWSAVGPRLEALAAPGPEAGDGAVRGDG
ncbi:MAG: dTMP kinase [Acidimicrobiales bacterium]|nr:dTMP kinase [Acidimicrobiales bacterium]